MTEDAHLPPHLPSDENHPNLARLWRFDKETGEWKIEEEFKDGISLKDGLELMKAMKHLKEGELRIDDFIE